jgi:hypothetical protein
MIVGCACRVHVAAPRRRRESRQASGRLPGEVPPPRVFCKKSPQTIENKGHGRKKERQEKTRACKLLTTRDLQENPQNEVHNMSD